MNPSPEIHIRLNYRLLPLLVGVLLLLQVLVPYDGWLVLLVGLGGAWLAGYFWVRLLSGKLSLRRERRFDWTQVGDRLEERFTVVNRSVIPAIWVEVVDQTNMPGYVVSRATGVSAESENQWRTQGICTQRGVYHLGPTSLRTADPLGIYTLEIHDPSKINLMVTPPVVPMPAIEVARGGRTGEGRPRPNAPERTISASSVREYVPGDSMRYIHWRTSARRDELFVRLFEGTPAGDWWIILDLDRRVQAGQGQDSTVEHGVILAASLADRGLRLRQAVGLAANSQSLTWLPPQRHGGQRWEILRLLALVTPGDVSLAQLLERMKPSFGKRSSLILITPNVGVDWIKPLLSLRWTGSVPTVLLLDPISFGSSGPAGPLLDSLAHLGIQRYLIGRDLLDRPEAHPGHAGSWEFRVTPTGRAIPVHQPMDQQWRILG